MKIRLEISPLASKHQSGVAQYTRLLAEALEKHNGSTTYGHYFDFLGRQPKPTLEGGQIKLEPNRLIPLRVYAKLQSYGIAPAFDILPPFNKPPVDLAIFTNFATWPSLRTKKRATVVHDLTYMYYPEATDEKNLAHLRRVVPRTIKKADFVITVSESVKKELEKELGLAPEKCIVTPIPPDEAFFTKKSNTEIKDALDKYKIPFEKYIYFIGNKEPRKNLIGLIAAYRALPVKTKKEYGLVMAGGNGWKSEATNKALQDAIDAGENIKHIGFIDQTDSPALYQGASLFVMPSLYEGFGMPILEAFASNVNVLANDIPVLRETGGDTAYYTNTTDIDRFSFDLNRCLGSPPKKNLSAQARRWSWSDNVQAIIESTERIK